MLSVSFGSNAAYLWQHVEERTGPERGNYYLSAAEHGEPQGQWLPGGAEKLGFTGAVDKETMLKLYDELVHPTTGEQLGSKPYRFKDQGERLAAAIAAEGGAVEPERIQELSLAIAKTNREARNYADLTFSVPKSWSVFHASLERAGRHEDAAKVWSAIMEGAEVGLEYLKEHAGYSRAGRHGTAVSGRTSGRWVEGKDWIASAWRHHTSRDGDPQLHVHIAVLNRVQNSDGKWRTLDSRAIYRARPGAAAVAERVAEEALVRELNVRFGTREDGLAREILGIDEPVRDLFSSRRRAVTERVAEMVTAYQERYGHVPNAYNLACMSEMATLETRPRKPTHPPSRAELLDGWEARMRAAFGERLDHVADSVQRTDEATAVPFRPERVVSRALADLESSRSVWTRHDLVAAVNRQLPDCLGGLSAPQVRGVVDELVDSALAPGGDVVKLTAPELVPVPEELRRADGRSVYEPPTAERYATTRQLELEDVILATARQRSARVIDRRTTERLVSTSTMSEPQAAAVREILTSGRDVETFIGAPGTGKTYTSAELARLWTEATGKPVLGLTTSERARQALEEEGFAHSSNIARWQRSRESLARTERHWARVRDDLNERAAKRELTKREREVLARADRQLAGVAANRLGPDHLVIVDEASMVATKDLADIVHHAQAAGAKVVFTGDDRQLGAPGTGGMFRMLGQTDAAIRLEDPRRFVHEWEAKATLALRAGDTAVLNEYDRHGRILHGTRDEMIAAAKQAYLGDHLRGKRSMLIVPTNELAARVASEVQADLIRIGEVSGPGVRLKDRNAAHVGDLIATRENDRKLGVVNRETYKVTAIQNDGQLIVNRVGPDGEVDQESRNLPPAYVAEHVELAYASTAHSAQSRTVERGHNLVDPNLSTREGFLVGQTRGSELNVTYTITHETETELHVEPLDRMTVLSQVLEREDQNRAATEILREELDGGAESLARLEPQWADVVGAGNVTRYAEEIRQRVGDETFAQIQADDAESSIYRAVRQHELAGGDVGALIERVTRDELDSADSPASVLTWRIANRTAERPAPPRSYAERTPERNDPAGAWARQLAEAMDARVRELGERAAVDQPAWTRELGPVPDDPADRTEWTHRAAAVAAYREAHGYHGDDPIGAAPPRGAVEARASWDLAYDALGRPEADRDISRATNGELERIIGDYEREKEWAPANVDNDLRETQIAARRWEAEATIEAARLERVETDAADREAAQLMVDAKRQLADELGERAAKLERITDARQQWWEETAETRRRHGLAHKELDRRLAAAHRQRELRRAPETDERDPEREATTTVGRTVAEPRREPATPERPVGPGDAQMDGPGLDDSAGQPTGDRDLQPASDATEPEHPEPRSEQTDQPGTDRSHEQSAERETAGVADERSHELENMGEREHERRPGTADLEQQVAEIEVDDPNHASERRDHAEAARFGAPDERARRAAGDTPDDEREWTDDTFTAGISRSPLTQPEPPDRQARGDDAQPPASTGWPDQPDRHHRPAPSDEDRSHTDRQPEQLAEPAEKPERDTAGVSEIRLPGEPQRQATDGPVHGGTEQRHPQELQRTPPEEEHRAGLDKAPEPVRREPPHEANVVVAPPPGEAGAKPERERFNIDQELARADAARAILAERRAEREAEMGATADRSSYQAVEQQRQVDRGIDR